jgi:hypothetical protein
MPEVTESLASALSRSKRAHKGDDSDNVGRAEEEDRASQEETHKAKEDAVELARQKIVAERAATDVDAAAEAEPARAEEALAKKTATEEAIASRASTDEVAREDVAQLRRFLAKQVHDQICYHLDILTYKLCL